MIPQFINLGNVSQTTIPTYSIKYYKCKKAVFSRRKFAKCTDYFPVALFKRVILKTKPNWKIKTYGSVSSPEITFFLKTGGEVSINFHSDLQMEEYRCALVDILTGKVKVPDQINVVYYMYNKSRYEME